MVNVDQIADLEHTLKQSGISEGVKIVIKEKLMVQPAPVPISQVEHFCILVKSYDDQKTFTVEGMN